MLRAQICARFVETEKTISHLFCECPTTLKLWDKVIKWIKEKVNQKIIMDKQIQLFGIPNHKMSALNEMFILCRFHIYKMKMKEGAPLFPLFQKDVKLHISLEKYIAIKNGNIEKFNKKWHSFTSLCEI